MLNDVSTDTTTRVNIRGGLSMFEITTYFRLMLHHLH